ncbi:MAG: N-6 DNA methylase [Pirellulales bacterium]
MLRADFPIGEDASIPLVGFAQLPADARSACVAVLTPATDPREAVESCRQLGAPLVFVCFKDTLQWWKQGTTSAEWLETIPAKNVNKFFKAHQDEFSPDAVYRAKTWGRFRTEYQLNFVDLGLLPLVEEQVGEELGSLIERNVSHLKARLSWNEVTSSQGHWLLQTVFWLVSGKILRDKHVETFKNLDLIDVNEVFRRVAKHYGTEPFEAGSQRKLAALKESARSINQFSSLALTTTESLAYVYENTLISKQTRSSLGTHSTPSFLVDYVIGNLAEWIGQIPEHDRSVFEPACGHAAFLVSAMRLLAELLPAEKAVPSRRGPYLRSRLHGTDIDPFALELARLSLTLTDIPNPDGWDLRIEDMFIGNQLAEQAERNTIFLANPPFANFKQGERANYSKSEVSLRFVNKAAEMLWRTIPKMSPGSVFGVVVPQTFLHSANAVDVRRFLVEHCQLQQIALFPDKAFTFSDAESAILLGRVLPPVSRRRLTTQYRHIREPQMETFKATFQASRTELVSQSLFNESNEFNLRVPDLADVWSTLGKEHVLDSVAELGQGLAYHGRQLPRGRQTFSEQNFPGAKQGFVRFEKGLRIDCLPKRYWMNLDPEVIQWTRTGATVGTPQVLLNYAPVSRGPWRLKALIDRVGRPAASRFITVRPRDQQYSLEVLWALLNSPIANGYAFTHLSKRDNIVGEIRKIPVPKTGEFTEVDKAAKAYLKAATTGQDPATLQKLMLKVDVEVLSQYSLPAELERAVLHLFDGFERVGVPFSQTSYLPEQLDYPIRLAGFLQFEKDWSATNRERGRLIDKRIAKTITNDEQIRLSALQAYADYYLDKVAPRPTRSLEELEDEVIAKSAEEIGAT